MTRDGARQLVAEEMAAFVAARAADNRTAAWQALERSHIVSQPYLGLHLASHWGMLRYAQQVRDHGEAVGQCLRLLLALLAAVFDLVPVGNTGRSDVSAFRPIPIPDDLQARMNGKS